MSLLNITEDFNESTQFDYKPKQGMLAFTDCDEAERQAVADEVQELASLLLAKAKIAFGSQTCSEEVIVDVIVNGFRCVVVPYNAPSPSGIDILTQREREITRLVAAGQPNKVVAATLNISPWTVSAHLRRIFAKLGVTSRAAMVAKTVGNANIHPSQPSVAHLS